jgi:hypothetical protein
VASGGHRIRQKRISSHLNDRALVQRKVGMMQRVMYSVVFRQDLLVHKGDYLDSVHGT